MNSLLLLNCSFFSTDYVFDGKNPPYGHTDEPNPLNFYGKSKLDGEKVVLQTDPSKQKMYDSGDVNTKLCDIEIYKHMNNCTPKPT